RVNSKSRLQRRFGRDSHLPVMVEIITLADSEFVENQVVKSCSHFFRDFCFLLEVVRGYDALLLQDREGFQGRIKTAIQGCQRIVDFGFHTLVPSLYIGSTKYVVRIIPPKLEACPAEILLSDSAEESGGYARPKASTKLCWQKRSAQINQPFRSLRMENRSQVCVLSSCWQRA